MKFAAIVLGFFAFAFSAAAEPPNPQEVASSFGFEKMSATVYKTEGRVDGQLYSVFLLIRNDVFMDVKLRKEYTSTTFRGAFWVPQNKALAMFDLAPENDGKFRPDHGHTFSYDMVNHSLAHYFTNNKLNWELLLNEPDIKRELQNKDQEYKSFLLDLTQVVSELEANGFSLEGAALPELNDISAIVGRNLVFSKSQTSSSKLRIQICGFDSGKPDYLCTDLGRGDLTLVDNAGNFLAVNSSWPHRDFYTLQELRKITKSFTTSPF